MTGEEEVRDGRGDDGAGGPGTARAFVAGWPADHPERSNHDHGVCVDADSLLPDWDGTPPDYDAAAHALLDATSPRKPHVEQDAPGGGTVSAETP